MMHLEIRNDEEWEQINISSLLTIVGTAAMFLITVRLCVGL